MRNPCETHLCYSRCIIFVGTQMHRLLVRGLSGSVSTLKHFASYRLLVFAARNRKEQSAYQRTSGYIGPTASPRACPTGAAEPAFIDGLFYCL